jgi:phosphate transport system permease protein
VRELWVESRLSRAEFGWKFFTGQDWDPVQGLFGALPFIYGTLLSSLLALVMAVPLGVGVAVFLTEICPRALRSVTSFFIEMLAAIPSVIYGLWGIFVLAPLLRAHVQPFLAERFGWTGLFDGPPLGVGMLAAGIILAIMIVPFISSITREVMMGDGLGWYPAQRPGRRLWRDHPGARPRARRDDGRHHADRQPAGDR